MFYGMNEAQQRQFRQALEVSRGIYPRNFAGDMLIARARPMGFREEPRFVAAVAAQQPNAQEASLLWRLHVMCWCARNALRLEGDFVECGVFRGFMTAVAAQYLDFGVRPKRWYLYDTFEGIPQAHLDPGHGSPAAYQETGLYEDAVRRFADYPNIGQHRGRVPEVLHGSAPQKIAF